MADSARKLKIDWNSVTIAGVRSRAIKANNELVDVTSDDSNGWRTFLDTPGISSLDCSISGITENQTLLADFFNNLKRNVSIALPTTTGTITGTFFIETYEDSGDHDGATEFSVELKSSGALVFTAGIVD